MKYQPCWLLNTSWVLGSSLSSEQCHMLFIRRSSQQTISEKWRRCSPQSNAMHFMFGRADIRAIRTTTLRHWKYRQSQGESDNHLKVISKFEVTPWQPAPSKYSLIQTYLGEMSPPTWKNGFWSVCGILLGVFQSVFRNVPGLGTEFCHWDHTQTNYVSIIKNWRCVNMQHKSRNSYSLHNLFFQAWPPCM